MTLPTDTTDLHAGPALHEALLALLPLVGRWEGTGTGVHPSSGAEFAFHQVVTFGHDGRPFLAYDSRAALLGPADEGGSRQVVRAAQRETGFWRPGHGADDIEVQLVASNGLAVTYAGVAGELRWELASTSTAGTPTARAVDGERRLYALVDEALRYVTELTLPGMGPVPHLDARLGRSRADGR